MNPKVKICCISSMEEANSAIAYGADAIGLVGNMPSGPGIISDDLILEIAANVPSRIHSFLLTSETAADRIVDHHKRTRTDTIQIVDELKQGSYADIRKELPFIRIVQVIHVRDASSIDYALKMAEHADYLLLDSGNPDLSVKELGGTGRTHNWDLSKKIVEQSKVPVFLAGGLHAGNVQQAIEKVQPYGLDLCSGVRTNGNLDIQKLEAFFKAVSVF